MLRIIFTYLQREYPGVGNIRGHKWLLEDPLWEVQTTLRTEQSVPLCRKGTLHPDGRVQLLEGFTWDGPSGPTVDTENWLRASAFHDALYGGLKSEAFKNIKVWKEGDPHSELSATDIRKVADDLMYDVLIKDEMHGFRAWYSWAAVRLSPWAARPGWPWRAFNHWL